LAADLLADALVAPRADPAPGSTVVLDVATLAAAHPALRRRALRSAALRAGCPASDLFAVHVDALDALVTAWRGQGPAHLPGDRKASRAYGRLSLGPGTATRAAPHLPSAQERPPWKQRTTQATSRTSCSPRSISEPGSTRSPRRSTATT